MHHYEKYFGLYANIKLIFETLISKFEYYVELI